MMTARPDTNTMNSTCTQRRPRKKAKKPVRHTDNTLLPIRINIRRSEINLSPNDEVECRQIYDKLQRLQPNGVCVNLDTLRRALYPPISQTINLNYPSSYSQHSDEMPPLRTRNVSKQNQLNKTANMDLHQIVNLVKQHAAINYSYYTRTK